MLQSNFGFAPALAFSGKKAGETTVPPATELTKR